MSITIVDIAKKSNVSIATVSRVINNKSEGVSEKTRKRILNVIDECGYKPNAMARGLVTKKTKTIGLIIPDITNPFFPEIARGAEDGASTRGYNVFLCNSDDNLEKENEYISALKEKCVDGIILTTSANSNQEHFMTLMNSGIPISIIDEGLDAVDADIPGIFLDNYEGGYLAAKHLIDLGHKRIACITGPLNLKNDRDRLEGYKEALKDSKINIDNSIIMQGNYKIAGGIENAKKLLSKDITAIFACNDLMAYGVYQVLKSNGYKIPDDISVVGFDDIQLSALLDPALTTIRQPAYEMGLESAKMIIKLIEGKNIRKKVINFKPDLIVRKSTGKIVDNKEGK
jgi:LacI family transcriptional regulator